MSAAHAVPAEVRLYDHLFARPDPGAAGDLMTDLNPRSEEVLRDVFVEAAAAEAPVGQSMQFERLGYFTRPRHDAGASRVRPDGDAQGHVGEGPGPERVDLAMTFRMGICIWTQQARWPDVLRGAEIVDELGFDHLWTIDHLLAPQGEQDQPILEAWSVLAGWATRTRTVGLGLFVGANTFHDPTVTAKLATTLDHMSGGRAIVGLGAGWFEHEHAAYGIDFGATPGERIGWLDEAAGIVRRL